MLGETLKRLGIPPATDYVRSFRQLVRWARPGRDYLARRKRARAAFRVGDYTTALEDARWCVLQRPGDAEAHLQRGLAALGAAAADAVDLPLTGAGAAGVRQGRQELLAEAKTSFVATIQADARNPWARLGLEAVEELARLPPEGPGLAANAHRPTRA